jgi:Ca2+-transporting ATPase
MMTGDHPQTAQWIGRQIGFGADAVVVSGTELDQLSDSQLQETVRQVQIFSRVRPEQKLRIVEALRSIGEVVAMTGDGVNDGPALKAAHIGIAMGKRGSEVAKSAASLILTDDDLSHMVEAVALGRKIYDNLKKAIRYIISIHIPIILIVLLPLLLGWRFPHVFSPVHVIFLELIMGPTCSIIYENEPIEAGTMLRMPRKASSTFLSLKQLWISIIQGLLITTSCLGIGYYFMSKGAGDENIRSLIFITLLFSNILLTLANRSFIFSVLQTMKYRNNLVRIIIGVTLSFIAIAMYVPFIRDLFGLVKLSLYQLSICGLCAIAGVYCIEIWKFYLRHKKIDG